ncbi:MerR family transcriptional regulator [Novispirillum sp. DQ9]|uniref:MerR family transcriptional regulator n=1 Tax=Novispirillum sp. DQ9 TaxID=3398612 RepID=UPI003C7E042B
MEEQFYTVTELAAQLGVTPRTIRFYEVKGLLTPRRVGTTRVYTHRERARMILILRGKRLGFSLRDIKEYLDLYVVDHERIEQVQHLLKKVRTRRTDLEDQRKALEETLTELDEIERQATAALRLKGIEPDAA